MLGGPRVSESMQVASMGSAETWLGRSAPDEPAVPVDPALQLHFLRTMRRIRAFEERMEQLFRAGRLPGFVHLYIGEEAVATGICAALRQDDYVTSTHRGHGHAIAKGAEIRKMAAELFGKATGTCGGRGGSMHVADFSVGMLGANGVVGGGFGIASGAAFSATYRGTDQVAVCFFGDGAVNKGTFHEAMNWAAVRCLPVVFVCENNQYAQFTPAALTTSVADVATRGQAYGIPAVIVDGNDVEAVYLEATRAVGRARAGDGPTLIEAKTYRHRGHYVGDPEAYRSRDEVAQERERDPITRLERSLASGGVIATEVLESLARDAAREVDEAILFAEESPFPEPPTALVGLFSAASPDAGDLPGPERQLTFGEATREAMRAAMAADESVLVMGEDIHWGGNFGQFTGLYDEFGEKRVVDMPISESLIVSAALGAAITGLRPIISMSFVDFTFGAMDELFNQVAKIRYMFGGQTSVPLVFRASDGAVRSAGAQHSQSLEAIFAHVPGIKVAIPSTVADAKGLLAAAIADGNPVMFMEHKVLGRARGPVPDGDYRAPLGAAVVSRYGRHATVVSYSVMAQHCLEVAEKLAQEGIQLEVIDLRTVVPLDFETVAQSVRKSGRVVVVHEAWKAGGFGGELAARIGEELFDYLDAPVVRVGAPSVPMPFSPPLEEAVVPQRRDIEAAVRAVLA